MAIVSCEHNEGRMGMCSACVAAVSEPMTRPVSLGYDRPTVNRVSPDDPRLVRKEELCAAAHIADKYGLTYLANRLMEEAFRR